MARIPRYVSQVPAEAGTRLDLPRVDGRAFGGQIGQGLQRVGQALGERAEEEQRESENQQRLGQLTRFVELRTETARDKQEARGAMAPDGAGHKEGLLKRFDERAAAFMGGITNPTLQAEYQARVAELRADLDLDESAYVVGVRAQKAASDADSAISNAANELAVGGSEKGLLQAVELFRQTFSAIPELNAEQRTKLTRYAENRLARSYIEGLSERDPYAARDVINSGRLNSLIDGDAMGVIVNDNRRMITLLENQRRAEQRAAEAERRRQAADARRDLLDQVREFREGLQAGVPASPADVGRMASLAAQLGNPALARNIALLGEEVATVTALRGANPREVAAARVELDAEIAKAGRNVSPALLARRKALDSYEGRLVQDVRQDPLGRGARDGVVTLAPLDPANPASFQTRARQARKVADRYGAPLQVLDPAEVEQFGTVLASGTPEQKRQVLGAVQLFGATGAAAALRQLSQVAPAAAGAGRLLSLKNGAPLAATVLRGEDLLKANPKAVPTTFETAAVRETRAALKFLPELQVTVPATARAWIAGRLGETGNEYKAAYASGAVNAVLGGRRGADGVMRGGLGERNGHAVLLPEGLSQDEFDAAIDGLSLARTPKGKEPVWADKTPVSVDELKAGKLFALPNGRYAVSPDATGDSLIRRADGTLFEITVGGNR